MEAVRFDQTKYCEDRHLTLHYISGMLCVVKLDIVFENSIVCF